MKLQDLTQKDVVFFAAETIPSASGSGINAFRFASFLSAYSKSVKIVCLNYNNKLRPYEKIDGVIIKRIRYYNKSLLTKILSFPNLILAYIKEPILHEITFIYGAYLPGFEILLLLNKLLKRKSIFQSTLLNDDDVETLLKHTPKLFRLFRKWMFSSISLYYAINHIFADIWFRSNINTPRIVVASPGVDTQTFKLFSENERIQARHEFKINTKELVIVSAGILSKRKGYLDTFWELSKLNISFLYLVAGLDTSNEYHKSNTLELKEMEEITRIGHQLLGDKIRFLGHLNEMMKLFAVCDIFLHGAFNEGTPNVILEAMSCGKPIIARDFPGLEFILKNNNSALVFNQSNEIGNLISKLYTNKSLREKIGRNANKLVIKHHSFDKVVDKVLIGL